MIKRYLLLPWLLAATPAWTQDQSAPSAAQTPAEHAERSATATGQQPASGTSKDRLFYTLPNFFTLENAGNVPPLTAGQKFSTTIRSSFDPVEFGWYAALAGISQAENGEHEYGQGMAGYGKRFGQQFGDGTIENFMSKAVFPSLLHQDPRYYQLGKGRFWHRVYYAVSRAFITRSDAGTTQFDFSEVLGAGSAAVISTYTYHPRDDRTLGNVAEVWGSQIAYDVIGYVAKEFWPDIRNKLHKNNNAGQAH